LILYGISTAISKIALFKGSNILANKIYTNTTSKVTNYISKIKGIKAAKADFNALKPTNVRTYPNGTIVGKTGDLTINIHPGSSVGSAPTLEIYNPSTGLRLKIRY
jgi:hypothetical protein